uniref:ADP,ATP carrier protein n=1 Tax=Panagrellus redivivus TaxID=6233 RepID=A0A7E4V126_PANRE
MPSPAAIQVSKTVLQYYSIYSTIMVILNYSVFPILLFIVATQSGKLGHIKYFIVNQTVWNLGISSVIGIFKPVIVTPVCGGYLIGFLEERAGLKESVVCACLLLVCSIGASLGVTLTLRESAKEEIDSGAETDSYNDAHGDGTAIDEDEEFFDVELRG